MLRVVSAEPNTSSAPRTLYGDADVQSISPTDWSPDGRWIAAVIRRVDHTAQIGVVRSDDGSLRVLKTVDWSRVGVDCDSRPTRHSWRTIARRQKGASIATSS